MDRVTRVNKALADVIRGAYKQEGFTLPTLSAATGIPQTTIQRITKGNSPVTMGDLESIGKAVGIPAVELFELALKKADRDEMSAATGTPVSLDTKRKQRQAAEMPGGALENEMKKAATRDDELDTPEPEAP